MTSTPVKSVGFGLNAPTQAAAGTKAVSDAGFQAVWNNQTGKQTEGTEQQQDSHSVKKTPGDSLKARDEHRARTEKREPSRNVEERTDIPEEKLEEAAEVLETAVVQIVQEVADTFELEPEEVQAIMDQLGLEQADVLTPQGLGSLILAVSGAEDSKVLLTDEGLYADYRELMEQLEGVLQECGKVLEVSPEQLECLTKELIGRPEIEPEEVPAEIPDADAGISITIQPKTEAVAAVSAEAPEKPEETVKETTEDDFEAVQQPEQKPETEQTKDNGNAGRDHGRKEGRQESGNEQGVNLFAQNLKAGQFEPQVQQTYAPESVWDTDTQNIMRQIMDYMKVNLKADLSTMEMQLHPASLGTVQVQIASRGGAVTASFITQNESVKAALESQMIQLQEQFEAQGVKVEAIEVTVQTHQFEQNLEQGRRGSSQEQEPARKGRVRRISLEDPVSVEEMEEEEALARKIMADNGNTVDYTA